jgi:hypothetical protein
LRSRRLFLLGWTIFTGIMLLATFRTNGALIVTFILLFLSFALLTIGELGPSKHVAPDRRLDGRRHRNRRLVRGAGRRPAVDL